MSRTRQDESASIACPGKHGFTWAIWWAVITIIGFLVALLMPSLQTARSTDQSNRAAAFSRSHWRFDSAFTNSVFPRATMADRDSAHLHVFSRFRI